MSRIWLAMLLCMGLGFTAAFAKDGSFDSNGVRMHYVEEGTGEPVILLHGRGGSTAVWANSGVFDNLKQSYRVIALDLRGHGQSGKPSDPRQYGREMGLDVIRLMDALGITQAHIVGHSLGANITSQLLTTHPERFVTATLSASTGRIWWTADDDATFERQAAGVENDTGSPEADRRALAALLRSFGDQAIAPAKASAVQVPTLGIVGSADSFLADLRKLHALRPSMKLVVVEGATHSGPSGIIGRPEFVAALREILSKGPDLAIAC